MKKGSLLLPENDLQLKTKTIRKSFFNANDKNEVAKSINNNTAKVDKIAKAFTAGTGITPETQPDGAAYRLESLDPTLNISTWGDMDYTIYKDLYRQPVNQTVQKYTVYYSHGRTGHQMFQTEIAKLSSNEPRARQKTVNVKFLVDTKGSSFAMQWANTTVDTNTLLEISGVNNIAKAIEYATFYGDSDLAAQDGEGLEFDGLEKLMDEHNKIDMRGTSLTPQALNLAAVKIGQGFGIATDAYMPIGVKADFVNEHLAAQRILQPNSAGNGMQVGFDVARFISARGNINLHGSTIMDLDKKLDLDQVPDQNAPAAPKVTTKVNTGTEGKFLADDKKDKNGNVVLNKEVGTDVKYRVVAVGNKDSLPSDVVTAHIANATDTVELTIQPNRLVASLPDYIAVYKQSDVPGDDQFWLVGRVAISKMQGDSIKFVDDGSTIPGTGDVFVLENKPETVRYLEFSNGILKFPLAITTTATNFALIWYGCLQVTFPKRIVLLKNVLYNSNASSIPSSVIEG